MLAPKGHIWAVQFLDRGKWLTYTKWIFSTKKEASVFIKNMNFPHSDMRVTKFVPTEDK